MSPEFAIAIYLGVLVFILSAVWSLTNELSKWAANAVIKRIRDRRSRSDRWLT